MLWIQTFPNCFFSFYYRYPTDWTGSKYNLINLWLDQYGFIEQKIIITKSGMTTSMRGNTCGRVRDNGNVDVNDNCLLSKGQKNKFHFLNELGYVHL